MKKATIRHDKGIHARVAAMVVQKSHELKQRYGTTLYFQFRDRDKILSSSLMPLIALRIKAGDEISVLGEGSGAEAAVNEMAEFLESDFAIVDSNMIRQMDTVLQNNVFTAEHVFHNIANGLIVTDEHDVITVFNPAAEKLFDLKAGEVVGRKVYDVIPDTRLHIVKASGQAEIGHRQQTGRSVIITNRTPIVVEGEAKGAIAIFEDISSLENVTDELRVVKELKERLNLILESVQDGICVVDRTGKITYVNSAYCRITETAAGEVVDQNVLEVSPAGARAAALLTGRPVHGSISRKANGQAILADVNPIIVEGEVTGAVSVIKNLSEVHALMEKLNEATARAEYLESELRRAKKPMQAFDSFIGRSGKVRDTLAIAAKAAAGQATVLIRGESGTGKEVVAEGIHFASSRAQGPFIRVNCAAIPAALLESELFGHERGAFTGAYKKKLGSFELADKGTIFLDEIGDMEKSMQAKLLRVLQDRQFLRVGGEKTVQVNVRIIAATNRNLEQMVAEGEFREDLYYRLNIIPIFLPPLRERKEDIPFLAEYFLRKFCAELGKRIERIRPEAMDVLTAYAWPGNVRELENIMERISTLADGPYLGLENLPAYLRETDNTVKVAEPIMDETEILPWDVYEKHIIKSALERCGTFNKAAKALGITHKTVAAKARKYDLIKTVAWEKV